MEANGNGNAGGFMSKIGACKPLACVVFDQAVIAVVNILYKLALNDGMNPTILVAYRFIFAAAFICPLAYFLERNRRPMWTWMVMLQACCCGLCGGTVSQNVYAASMKTSSATFASAILNLVPAVTFVLAVMFRLEPLAIGTAAGKARVVGAIVGVGGAMFIIFYKGSEIKLWSGIQDHSQAKGFVLAIISCIAHSLWMIIQASMKNVYPRPFSSTALMCFTSAVQSVIFAFCFNKDTSQWRFGFDVRLLTVFFSGVIGSGLSSSFMAWCIQQKGLLFATSFNPVMIVTVAVLEWLLLRGELYPGIFFGVVLILTGMWIETWGKGGEVVDEASKSLREPIINPSSSSAQVSSSSDSKNQNV